VIIFNPNITTLVNINGNTYIADFDYKDFKEGDLVLDRSDGAYSTIDSIFKDKAVLRDGYVVEGNVDFKRLIKLQRYPNSDKLIEVADKTGLF
jgi:hypothetical protein